MIEALSSLDTNISAKAKRRPPVKNNLNELFADDCLMDSIAAAKYLGMTPKTLEVWRSTKKVNIPFFKIGGAVRYRKDMLDDFLKSTIVNGSAE